MVTTTVLCSTEQSHSGLELQSYSLWLNCTCLLLIITKMYFDVYIYTYIYIYIV